VGNHEALLRDILGRHGIAEDTCTSSDEWPRLALDEQPERVAVARDDRPGKLAVVHMLILPRLGDGLYMTFCSALMH
jgi:hypothetical protein